MARKKADGGELPTMAQQILEKAKERGLESNFLFSTTFERYLYQLESLKQIKAAQEASPVFDIRLTRLFNSTTSGANGTASTLVAIIKKLGSEEPQEDKFRDFLNQFKDDDD